MSKIVANSKSVALELSDAQIAMIRAAAQRDDRCLTPPTNSKPAAVRKAGEKLIEIRLAREILAKAGMPAWRRDVETSRSYALKLTALGLKAIAVDETFHQQAHSETASAALEVEIAEGPIAPEHTKDTAAASEPGVAIGNDNGAEHGNSLLEAKASL